MSEVPRDDQNRSLLSALCGSDCRFWVVFDAIADGIFISDPTTGRFIEINQPGCRMFGYSKSELIGLKIEALSSGVHPYTQEMVIERIEKARLEGPQTFEWHCKTKDEVLFWAEISIHCKQIEQIPAVVAIVRDITNPTSPTEGVGRRQAAEILGMQLQRSALVWGSRSQGLILAAAPFMLGVGRWSTSGLDRHRS